jgi:hypothetical protein
VDDPEVDRELGEVDRLADRVAVGVGDLVDRVAERPGLHLDHRVGLAVVEVEVRAVLQNVLLTVTARWLSSPEPNSRNGAMSSNENCVSSQYVEPECSSWITPEIRTSPTSR